MEKKMRMKRKDISSKDSEIINETNGVNFSDGNDCGCIIYIDEPMEEYAKKHGLISLEESWRRVNDIIDKAKSNHGR